MRSPMLDTAYRGKTVCVTGHTGFKGSWLCEWLLKLGAKVVGYALSPPTTPALFDVLQLSPRLASDHRGDVRSLDGLQSMLREDRPDIIFHLAAQPLVRRAFEAPHETIETNVMGSLNVLEAVRRENRPCVVVMVTSDKAYRNVEWLHAYREHDPLGGDDPYSASKACAELLIASYRASFLSVDDSSRPLIAVANGRGGNVIGGGDWAPDRIVPDCIRYLTRQQPIPVRNRHATRPWQHVLDLLSGYLTLGARLLHACHLSPRERSRQLPALCSAFNFGPETASHRSVATLVQTILRHWPGDWENLHDPQAANQPEASKLHLAIDKAYHVLNWRPTWDFETAVRETVVWYRQHHQAEFPEPSSIQHLTQQQIDVYMAAYEAHMASCREG